MEKHTKYDAGQDQAHFDNISANYDDIMKTVGYPDPELIAEFAKKVAAEKMIARTEAEVADFGCGTGLVGEALAQNGFTNVYGIDCSDKMLEIAEEKDVYKSLTKHKLGGKDFMDGFPQHLKNKFDFVTAGALIEANHY